MDVCVEGYVVPVPMELIDGLGEVAACSGDLVQALECTHTAVCSGLSDPEAYIEGMVGVLLLAAKYVHAESASLCDAAERVLDEVRSGRQRVII